MLHNRCNRYCGNFYLHLLTKFYCSCYTVSIPSGIISYKCTFEAENIFFGFEAKKKVQQIPVTIHTFRSGIEDLSTDIILQTEEGIRASPTKISIQLDESINFDNHSYLVYSRYIKGNEILEDLLFCE